MCLQFLVRSINEVKHPSLSNRLIAGTMLAFQNSFCVMLDFMMAEGKTNVGRLQNESDQDLLFVTVSFCFFQLNLSIDMPFPLTCHDSVLGFTENSSTTSQMDFFSL